MKRWGWLAGILFIFWIYVGIGLAATLYQTTPAPKITYPYDVGIKVATDSDTPLNVTISDSTLIDTIVDLVLADTGTVYSYALPANTVIYEYQARTAVDVRYAKSEAGITSNYRTLKSGSVYNTPDRAGTIYTGTLYFKDPVNAGTVIEITIWTK